MTRRIQKKTSVSLHSCALWMLVFQFLSHRRYAVTIEILVSLGRAAYTYVSVNVVGRNRSVSIWMHNTRTTIKLLYIIWKCQTTTRPHTTSEVEHTPLRNSAQGTRFHEQLSLIDNTQPFLLYSGKIAAITVPNSGKNTVIEKWRYCPE